MNLQGSACIVASLPAYQVWMDLGFFSISSWWPDFSAYALA
jgi:hypothetical protein